VRAISTWIGVLDLYSIVLVYPLRMVLRCRNMLTRVWQELEYRIDVYRATRGAHIEHL